MSTSAQARRGARPGARPAPRAGARAGRLAAGAAAGAVRVFLVLAALFWLLPTLGLLISSFLSPPT